MRGGEGEEEGKEGMAGGVWTRSSSEGDDGADVGDSAGAGCECLVETRGREEP
jgi:hypothetical protein